jgi:hypothetical protein
MRRASGRCAALRLAAEPSWDQAIRDDLLEDTTRGHRHAIIVSPVYSAKLPATTAAVEILKEAVPSTTPSVCLDGVGAILLE